MIDQSALLAHEPNWRPASGCRTTIPAAARSWIYERTSLTRRLRNACGNIEVQVLAQRRTRPFPGETQRLNMRIGRYALVREVMLQCEQRPLILARTIIPLTTLRGSNRRLSRLGTRPLGEVIFSYPGLQRLQLDLTRIDDRCWTNNARQKGAVAPGIWGRRTLYSVAGHPLLVCEFFLPSVFSLEPRQ